MAKETRAQLTQKVLDRVFDNNAKQVTTKNVRDVFNALIESCFNLLDDELKSLKYEGNITLEQAIDSQLVLLHSKSAIIDVRNQAEGSNVSGDSNASMVVSSNDGNHDNDLWLEVSFSDIGTTNYFPILMFESTGSPWHQSNNVVLTFGSINSSSLNVYLQGDTASPFGKVWLTLLKL